MIIDQLTQLQQYTSLHSRFPIAIEYILNTDLHQLPIGETQVSGDDIKAIIIEAQLLKEEYALDGFECHNTYIDIQVCIVGSERVGWKSRNTCHTPKGEYSIEKDVLFFNEVPDTYFELKEGMFGIYFPTDVHAPMIGEGNIKKLVMKVRV